MLSNILPEVGLGAMSEGAAAVQLHTESAGASLLPCVHTAFSFVLISCSPFCPYLHVLHVFVNGATSDVL